MRRRPGSVRRLAAALAVPWGAAWLACAAAAAAPRVATAQPAGYAIERRPADAAGGWVAALHAAGFPDGPVGAGRIVVVPGAPAAGAAAGWRAAAANGAVLVVVGTSPVAAAFGVVPVGDSVDVRREDDVHAAEGELVLWRDVVRVPRVRVPAGARVFSRERWSGAPLLVGMRVGRGVVVWSAVDPGPRGFERLPYAAHALADLGVAPPFVARRLHAFFDYSYRSRADVDYLARAWRAMGVATLYVSSWHFVERDPARDAYLQALIEACHRHGIRAYAWLELPHVSEAFWVAHPEWREKNGLLQDAAVFWRKNMNLVNEQAFAAAAAAVDDLLARFDWDGVNLSELYFEGLRDVADPSHLTPFNDDVRREVRQRYGFDPAGIFDPASPAYHERDPSPLRQFRDYRADLQLRLHRRWLGVLDAARRRAGGLALVVCYVDDVSEPTMRDLIGADVRRLLPLAEEFDFTLLVQDPYVLWPLGPERYRRIAADYARLAGDPERLAVDINIVARQAHAFPTDHQSGTELLQLVSTAQRAFPTVALYAEHSVRPVDRARLPAALAVVRAAAPADGGRGLVVDSPRGVGVRWAGPVLVDGRPWPFQDSSAVWLPAGRHELVPAPPGAAPHARLLDFNATLRSLALTPTGLALDYESDARAIAILAGPALAVTVDGAPASPERLRDGDRTVLRLPAGAHRVVITTRR